jgi:hypothetical protein
LLGRGAGDLDETKPIGPRANAVPDPPKHESAIARKSRRKHTATDLRPTGFGGGLLVKAPTLTDHRAGTRTAAR